MTASGSTLAVLFIFAFVQCIQCQARRSSCRSLSSPSRGSVVCQGVTLGSSCTFSCDPNTRMIGFMKVTCLPDGTWSSATPRCLEPSCSSLRAPYGGTTSGTCSGAKPGAECRFSCTRGQLIGSSVLVCGQDLTWNSSPPACTDGSSANARCPSVNSISNGLTNGKCNQAQNGDMCSFACLPGFTLQGSPTLQCLADGSWSAAAPRCA